VAVVNFKTPYSHGDSMSRELLQQALNALLISAPLGHAVEDYEYRHKLIKDIEAELAKPKQAKYSDIVSDGGLDPRNKFDAQPESFDWLPKHAAGLHITHNDHKNVYYTIEDHYGYIDDREWVSPEEKLKAIELDSVWELHWYPDTPIGSYKVVASSLEAIQKHIMENGNAYR
jgi:hypothetical protein